MSPIISNERLQIARDLQDNYNVILDEYLDLRKSGAVNDYDYGDHKLHSGEWDWKSCTRNCLYVRSIQCVTTCFFHADILKGKRQAEFAVRCPLTVEILESATLPRLMTGTPFSFAFFSTLGPNSFIKSHFGPCNLRLRCHFPLVIPPSESPRREKSDHQDRDRHHYPGGTFRDIHPNPGTTVDVGCGMEVGGYCVQWEAGKPLFFDDTYEHRGKVV